MGSIPFIHIFTLIHRPSKITGPHETCSSVHLNDDSYWVRIRTVVRDHSRRLHVKNKPLNPHVFWKHLFKIE